MDELDRYDYELPRELIAQEPLANRSDARLMVVDRGSGEIEHFHIRDLPELLSSDDTLVLNNSRVIPARLVGHRTRTAGRWQGLFLRADQATGVWELLTRTRGTLQAGETLTIRDRHGRDGMLLTIVARTEDGNLLVSPALCSGYTPIDGRQPASDAGAEAWLELFGRVPIPPYIRDGQMVDADVQHYQTVFAKTAGSVAAPTAGLHFTESLLQKLRDRGLALAEVTLHVGIGTFRPIQTAALADHRMHREWGSIDHATAELINRRRGGGGRCIAVGTTSVRVLESAAAQALGTLAAGTLAAGTLAAWTGETDLFIRPPYSFRAVDSLLTNFHLPRSSLLVMISAFADRELVLRAYRIAAEQGYRFYSYGDAMLITGQKK
jgi:S-adenosylmethionine:tRNA ribosyltransferase-isomerase